MRWHIHVWRMAVMLLVFLLFIAWAGGLSLGVRHNALNRVKVSICDNLLKHLCTDDAGKSKDILAKMGNRVTGSKQNQGRWQAIYNFSASSQLLSFRRSYSTLTESWKRLVLDVVKTQAPPSETLLLSSTSFLPDHSSTLPSVPAISPSPGLFITTEPIHFISAAEPSRSLQSLSPSREPTGPSSMPLVSSQSPLQIVGTPIVVPVLTSTASPLVSSPVTEPLPYSSGPLFPSSTAPTPPPIFPSSKTPKSSVSTPWKGPSFHSPLSAPVVAPLPSTIPSQNFPNAPFSILAPSSFPIFPKGPSQGVHSSPVPMQGLTPIPLLTSTASPLVSSPVTERLPYPSGPPFLASRAPTLPPRFPPSETPKSSVSTPRKGPSFHSPFAAPVVAPLPSTIPSQNSPNAPFSTLAPSSFPTFPKGPSQGVHSSFSSPVPMQGLTPVPVPTSTASPLVSSPVIEPLPYPPGPPFPDSRAPTLPPLPPRSKTTKSSVSSPWNGQSFHSPLSAPVAAPLPSTNPSQTSPEAPLSFPAFPNGPSQGVHTSLGSPVPMQGLTPIPVLSSTASPLVSFPVTEPLRSPSRPPFSASTSPTLPPLSPPSKTLKSSVSSPWKGPSFHSPLSKPVVAPLPSTIPSQNPPKAPSSFPTFPKAPSQGVHSSLGPPVPMQRLTPPSQLPSVALHSPPLHAVHGLSPPAPAPEQNFSHARSPRVIPLGSPTPARAKSPSVRLPVPAPSSILPLPAIAPPVPHAPRSIRQPSRSLSPSSSSVPGPSRKILPPPPFSNPPQKSRNAPPPSFSRPVHTGHKQTHSSAPSPAPAPAPAAISGRIHKSTSAPIPHSSQHGHTKPPFHAPPGHTPTPPPAPVMKPRPPVAKPPLILPSPPPNQDCATVLCSAPYTQTPLGSPCGCVLPIQVELELGVALYALFPLISVLAEEIAYGTLLLQSEVRIVGASADSQDQDKSIVQIDLVPLGEAFDNLTALLIFQKFWNHEVPINETFFGNYAVIYVLYPGLPPSPPSAYPGGTNTGVSPGAERGPGEQPLGVNINKKSEKIGGGTIAVVTLSSAIAVVICLGVIWFMLLKCSDHTSSPPIVEPRITSYVTKRPGGASMLSSDLGSSTSISFASSMATFAGAARTFSYSELERATDKFNLQNVVGEGGFGRVYCGVLDDGSKVAVKVLTRDDQQGGKEFVAEVEMLSRLHHRNLVKLIGICTEEHNRCLVYELIPNGSVESHLHGIDKETAPLDWDARMKIALGAARGLAYLHEDSNPRVIHRDFKASNILLESDFTPKVSDFGLAKAAPDEGSRHISTRVMGTFGYVAPEYAMTGHLLVKSDVYSYGVVLLELLSGRKPVDMSQPTGQENLVSWARPLLSSREGLEMLVDPSLGSRFPFDNMARVAAIASMCVQPEVSHRPFMGEVVQALKLVYNDSDACNGLGSVAGSPLSQNSGARSGQPWEGPGTLYAHDSTSFISVDYDSGPMHATDLVSGRPLSASALVSNSGRFVRQLSGSFRRHSTSGPLSTTRSTSAWNRARGVYCGSMSEHGMTRHFGRDFDRDAYELWP